MGGPNPLQLDFASMARHVELISGAPDTVVELFTGFDGKTLDGHKRVAAVLNRRLVGAVTDPSIQSELIRRQKLGGMVAATMAESDLAGRRAANMIRPRVVWIEADGPIDISRLALPPTLTVETSPGRHHFVWRIEGLTWSDFDGFSRRFVHDFGSDPAASLRTQVLRLAGSLHQKNPLCVHVVKIIDPLTSGNSYSLAEFTAAFPPIFAEPAKRRYRPGASEQRHTQFGTWSIAEITSVFVEISDLLVRAAGSVMTRKHRETDIPVEMNWSEFGFWSTCVRAIHHGCGGSAEGLELSKSICAGDSRLGLVGAPDKFDPAHQEEFWRRLEAGDGKVTMATPRFFIQELRAHLGLPQTRRGRPFALPGSQPLSETAEPVVALGRQLVDIGLERVRLEHEQLSLQRYGQHGPKAAILRAIRDATNPKTGAAHLENVSAWSTQTLARNPETVRYHLWMLASSPDPLIVKSDGRSASLPGPRGAHRGMAVAMRLPATILASLTNPTSTEQISAATVEPAAENIRPDRWIPNAPPLSYGGKTSITDQNTNALAWWRAIGVIRGAAGDHLEALAQISPAPSALEPITDALHRLFELAGRDMASVPTLRAIFDDAAYRALLSARWRATQEALVADGLDAGPNAVKTAVAAGPYSLVTMDTMPAEWRPAFKEALVKKLGVAISKSAPPPRRVDRTGRSIR